MVRRTTRVSTRGRVAFCGAELIEPIAHPRPFRFGLQVATAPSGRVWREEARRAEDVGFDTIVVPDHVADGLLSPMVALATMADATS
ncbi:MAG: hypothetical protein QOH10_2299, partial [Actinomycetota bacterium]|nr:hypothetical protein [Actinomycetota bacterium]